MRRLLICAVLALSTVAFAAPAGADECHVIVVHRPDAPPTKIEICP